MRRIPLLLVLTLITVLLAGCYNDRIDDIDKRLTKLEDQVTKMQDALDKVKTPPQSSGFDKGKLMDALQQLKKIAEEKSYREDEAAKGGEGALDITAMDRKDVLAGKTDQLIPGVAVMIDGKKVGETKADGGLIVRGLKPGPKTVTFSKDGYKNFELNDIDVRAEKIKIVTGLMDKL